MLCIICHKANCQSDHKMMGEIDPWSQTRMPTLFLQILTVTTILFLNNFKTVQNCNRKSIKNQLPKSIKNKLKGLSISIDLENRETGGLCLIVAIKARRKQGLLLVWRNMEVENVEKCFSGICWKLFLDRLHNHPFVKKSFCEYLISLYF